MRVHSCTYSSTLTGVCPVCNHALYRKEQKFFPSFECEPWRPQMLQNRIRLPWLRPAPN